MKPAATMSHIEARSAALQNLQPAGARVFDYARLKEGLAEMR